MGDIGDFPNTFNNSGSLYSLCSSDGKLKIWDTSNNILKQECVRTSHLNSCCTCLIWIQVTKHVSDAMCFTLIKTNLINARNKENKKIRLGKRAFVCFFVCFPHSPNVNNEIKQQKN